MDKGNRTKTLMKDIGRVVCCKCTTEKQFYQLSGELHAKRITVCLVWQNYPHELWRR